MQRSLRRCLVYARTRHVSEQRAGVRVSESGCAVLCCAVLLLLCCCVVLCSAVLCCAVRCGAVRRCAMLCCVVRMLCACCWVMPGADGVGCGVDGGWC